MDIDGALTGRDAWRRRVAASGDRTCLRFGDRGWTFAELDESARGLAAGLRAIGVGLGTRVLVGLANSERALATHVALRELGAVIVPLMPGMAPAEHRYQVEHCEATILIADASVADGLLPALRDASPLRTIVFDGDPLPPGAHAFAEVGAHPPLPPDAGLPGHDDRSPAQILYTSGSTGKPKAVLLPAGAMPSAGRGYGECFGVGGDDVCFLPLPLAHAVGGVTLQGVSMLTGCALAIEERFRPSTFWGRVAATGATFSILFPAQCNLLLETEAGAPGPGETTLRLVITHMYLPAFEARFGVSQGLCWGMTETGATSVGTGPGYRGERGEGYVGRPMVGVEVAVMDAERRPLSTGEDGEICLRHRHIMLEYLRDPDNTASTVVDGWVHSGDRGRLADDGGLYYRGRFKNLIKRSGENISAEEVELVLDRHPAVAESLVFGVPDPLRTEEVAAVLVRAAGSDVDLREVSTFVGQSLSRWKVPRYIHIVDAPLPRLGNGKLDRALVSAEVVVADCWDRAAVPDR